MASRNYSVVRCFVGPEKLKEAETEEKLEGQNINLGLLVREALLY
jgi:hypothetical protein